MSWFDKLFGEDDSSKDAYQRKYTQRRQQSKQSESVRKDELLPQNNDVYQRPKGKFRFPVYMNEVTGGASDEQQQPEAPASTRTTEAQKHVHDQRRHRRRRQFDDAPATPKSTHYTQSHASSQQQQTTRQRDRGYDTTHVPGHHIEFKASEVPSAIYGTAGARKDGQSATKNMHASEDTKQATQRSDIHKQTVQRSRDKKHAPHQVKSQETPNYSKRDNTINIENIYASQIVEEIRRERERKAQQKRRFKAALQEKREQQSDKGQDDIQKALDDLYAEQAQRYVGDSTLNEQNADDVSDTTASTEVPLQEDVSVETTMDTSEQQEEARYDYEEIDITSIDPVIDPTVVSDDEVEDTEGDTSSESADQQAFVQETEADDADDISDAQFREVESVDTITNDAPDDATDESATIETSQQTLETEANQNDSETETISQSTSQEMQPKKTTMSKNTQAAHPFARKPFNVVMTPSDKKRLADLRAKREQRVQPQQSTPSMHASESDVQHDQTSSTSQSTTETQYGDTTERHDTAPTQQTTSQPQHDQHQREPQHKAEPQHDAQPTQDVDEPQPSDASLKTTSSSRQQQQTEAHQTSTHDETAKRPSIRRGPMIKLPDASLLDTPEQHEVDQAWIDDRKQELNEALYYFNVPAEVQNVIEGPSVTRFELSVEKGVKVSRITALQDDIKMALAAKDIRIEAPIPGTSLVGIEVPNQAPTKVNIRSIIESNQFKNAESKLTVAMGYSINNEPLLMDIAKTPHALIAGATGSGKSVCINSILLSLLYRNHPEELKLLLIDPKMVELAPYNDLPHLVAPVITDVKAATQSLKWAVEEMENRYKQFAQYHVRNITAYNKKAPYEARMPKIVIVIDELADLMMMAPQDVETSIARIAQKARACGIHMLVATQRPSVNVITGLIKANIPTRIAFMVSSSVDSRTILDSGGAERLLGYGDMLYLGSGMNKPIRVQGTFVSDEEIDDVVDFIKQQRGPEYVFEEKELLKKTEAQPQDDLFDDVCRFMIQEGHISTSLIQRHFQIGYNRAARMIDQLAQMGYISEANGSKPRDVYVTEEDLES